MYFGDVFVEIQIFVVGVQEKRIYDVDMSKECLMLLKKLMYTGFVEVEDEQRPEFMRILEEFSIENSIGIKS